MGDKAGQRRDVRQAPAGNRFRTTLVDAAFHANEGVFIMASGTTSTGGAASASSDLFQNIYIPSLQNTLALEKQAQQMIERQLERYKSYPEMTRILQQQQQMQRLETVLQGHGSDRSLLKDTVTQLAGNLGALFHSTASDEILKNLYTDHALENYEIAAYRSLIVIAQAAGDSQNIPTFQQSLREEENAARLIGEQIEPVTRRYLELERSGQQANR
jgi:ferritin-like metal-binding protein YciE